MYCGGAWFICRLRGAADDQVLTPVRGERSVVVHAGLVVVGSAEEGQQAIDLAEVAVLLGRLNGILGQVVS